MLKTFPSEVRLVGAGADDLALGVLMSLGMTLFDIGAAAALVRVCTGPKDCTEII